MLPKQYGHIVNITSQISLVANEGETVYCASKGGMNQMTRVLARIPRGTLGTIDDVASAVHYLASDHANMASGTVLVIDGGWTAV